MNSPKVFIKVNEKGCRIGESHPRAVLNDHEVDLLLELLIDREDLIATLEDRGCSRSEIDATLCEEQLSYRQLGIKFEVHAQCIAKINRGERRCQIPTAFHPVPMKVKK